MSSDSVTSGARQSQGSWYAGVQRRNTYLFAISDVPVSSAIAMLESLHGQRFGCPARTVDPVFHDGLQDRSKTSYRCRDPTRVLMWSKAVSCARARLGLVGLPPNHRRVSVTLTMPPKQSTGASATAALAHSSNSVRAKSKQVQDSPRKTVFRPVLDNPLSIAWCADAYMLLEHPS